MQDVKKRNENGPLRLCPRPFVMTVLARSGNCARERVPPINPPKWGPKLWREGGEGGKWGNIEEKLQKFLDLFLLF